MRNSLNTIPRRVWLLTVFMVLLTTLPYIVAVAATPPGSTFSGAIIDPVDFNSHMAKMQQGMRGEWRYRLLFTDEPHEGIYLQSFYVALGHIACWTGLNAPLIYHIARIIFTALMMIALCLFARRFLSEQAAWWALILCIFGGGFGFVLYLLAPAQTLDVSPIELWLIDAYVFFSAFTFPHFAAAISLLALIFLNLDRWTRDGSRGAFGWTIGLTLILGIIQPFHLLLVGVIAAIIIGVRVITRRINLLRAIAGLALLGVGSGAIVGYQWIALHQDTVFRAFTDQNVTLSPPPIYYILGFAPLLIPALFGLIRAINQKQDQFLLPGIWLVSAAVLVYIPFATQRRFTLAIQLPMAVMALYWFADVAIPYLRRRSRRYRSTVLVYLCFAVLSTVIVYITWIGAAVKTVNQYDSDILAVWNWIRQNTDVDAVFYTTFEAGGKLVANTGRRVQIGHWYETMDYETKLHEVEQFYSANTNDSQRSDILRTRHADYLYYDPREHGAQDWKPTQTDTLAAVYQSETITIYKVVR